ncbi:MAG: hypothetical protein PVJ01_02420 [Pseudomonadota bacterium]|jgi:hypothetical protein
MGRKGRIKQLAELFNQTDSAYSKYEKEVLNGHRDVEWPEWYAEYLIGHGLDLLTEDRIAAEILAGFLLESKAEHKASRSTLTWEEYTATRIIDRFV